MSNRVKFIYSGIIVLFLSLFLTLSVNAQGFGLDETAKEAGLIKYGASIPSIIGNVIGSALSLIGIVFFGLMIYGGVLWMTARGKSEQETKAMDSIIAAAIGLVIIVASYAITSFVFNKVGISGGSGADKTGDEKGCIFDTTKAKACLTADKCVVDQEKFTLDECKTKKVDDKYCKDTNESDAEYKTCCIIKPGTDIKCTEIKDKIKCLEYCTWKE